MCYFWWSEWKEDLNQHISKGHVLWPNRDKSPRTGGWRRERPGWWLKKWDSFKAEATISYCVFSLYTMIKLAHFILVHARVRAEASRTCQLCAPWLWGFAFTIHMGQFSAIFSSNTAIPPITLFILSRTHHRYMLSSKFHNLCIFSISSLLF